MAEDYSWLFKGTSLEGSSLSVDDLIKGTSLDPNYDPAAERKKLYEGMGALPGTVADPNAAPQVELSPLARVYEGMPMWADPAGALERLAFEKIGGAPKGTASSMRANFVKGMGGGALVGLGEMAGLLPEGTKKKMDEDQQAERVSLAAAGNSPGAAVFGSGGAELLGGLVPGGAAVKVAKGLSEVNALQKIPGVLNAIEAAKASPLAARAIGATVEGAAWGAAESQGYYPKERVTMMGMAIALSGGGSVAEGWAAKYAKARQLRLETDNVPAASTSTRESTQVEAAAVLDELSNLDQESPENRAPVILNIVNGVLDSERKLSQTTTALTSLDNAAAQQIESLKIARTLQHFNETGQMPPPIKIGNQDFGPTTMSDNFLPRREEPAPVIEPKETPTGLIPGDFMYRGQSVRDPSTIDPMNPRSGGALGEVWGQGIWGTNSPDHAGRAVEQGGWGATHTAPEEGAVFRADTSNIKKPFDIQKYYTPEELGELGFSKEDIDKFLATSTGRINTITNVRDIRGSDWLNFLDRNGNLQKLAKRKIETRGGYEFSPTWRNLSGLERHIAKVESYLQTLRTMTKTDAVLWRIKNTEEILQRYRGKLSRMKENPTLYRFAEGSSDSPIAVRADRIDSPSHARNELLRLGFDSLVSDLRDEKGHINWMTMKEGDIHKAGKVGIDKSGLTEWEARRSALLDVADAIDKARDRAIDEFNGNMERVNDVMDTLDVGSLNGADNPLVAKDVADFKELQSKVPGFMGADAFFEDKLSYHDTLKKNVRKYSTPQPVFFEPWMKQLPTQDITAEAAKKMATKSPHGLLDVNTFRDIVTKNPKAGKLFRVVDEKTGQVRHILSLTTQELEDVMPRTPEQKLTKALFDRGPGGKLKRVRNYLFEVQEPTTPRKRGMLAFHKIDTQEVADSVQNPVAGAEIMEGAISHIEDAIDNDAKGKIAQDVSNLSEKEVQAIIDGDPKVLGSQEEYVAARTALETMKEKHLAEASAAKEALRKSFPNAPKSAIEAINFVRSLRDNLYKQATTKDQMAAMDLSDALQRDRLESARSILEATDTHFAEDRTMQDAVSEHLDTIFAAADAQTKEFAALYAKMAKANKLPIDPETQLPIDVNQFITLKQQEFVDGARQALFGYIQQAIGAEPPAPGTPGPAFSMTQGKMVANLAQIDNFTQELVKKFGLSDKEPMIFRANRAIYTKLNGIGADWISKNKPSGKTLQQMSLSELAQLGKRASKDADSGSAITHIKAEVARRAGGGKGGGNTPPKPPSGDNPEELANAARATAGKDAALVAAQITAPPGQRPLRSMKGNLLQRTFNNFIDWAETQLHSDLQLTTGKIVAFTGFNIPKLVRDIQDPAKRAGLKILLRSIHGEEEAVKRATYHQFETALADLGTAVDRFIAKGAAAGTKLSRFEVYKAIKTAYESGNLESLGDPDLVNAIKTTVMPRLQELELTIAKQIHDQTLQRQIVDNLHKYIFRQYVIYRDPEAIVKGLDTSAPAYMRFFAKTKKENVAAIKQWISENHLMDQYDQLTPDEQAKQIDLLVNNRVHGIIEARVRGLLKIEGEKNVGGRTAVSKPNREYLFAREIEDGDLRTILGEQENFHVAVQEMARHFISDIALFNTRKRFFDAFREAGLIGESPIQGARSQVLQAADLKEIALPGTEGHLYDGKAIHATDEVYRFFKTLNQSSSSDPMAAGVNRVISLHKGLMVFSPGNMMAQIWGMPQMILSSVGPIGLVRAVLKHGRAGFHIAQELNYPGSQKGFGRGMWSKETIRAASEDLIRRGLDYGGEWVEPFAETTHALTENPKGMKGVTLGRVSRRIEGTFKTPDIIAKTVTYLGLVDEITWKRGLNAPTEEVMNEAAHLALNMTQNPNTTISAVKNLSRGVLGLATYGFQGFIYQSMKNMFHAGTYALKDFSSAAKYAADGMSAGSLGDTAGAAKANMMARRHALAATNRSLGVLAAGFLFQEAIKGGMKLLGINFAGKEQSEGLRPFLYKDQQSGRIDLSHIERDGKGGIAAVVYMSSGNDYYENVGRLAQVIASSAASGQNVPVAVLNEFSGLMLNPSPAVEAMMDLVGGRLTFTPSTGPEFSTRGSLQKEKDTQPHYGNITATGVGMASKRIAGSTASQAVGLATGGYHDPEFAELAERRKNIMIRWGTGIRRQNVILNEAVPMTFSEVWNRQSSWMRSAREEFAAARNYSSKQEVARKYEKQWLDMNKEMGELVDGLTNMEITRPEIVQLLTGKDANSSAPKMVLSNIAHGRYSRFYDYLSTATRGAGK